jgi:hypothetical protein
VRLLLHHQQNVTGDHTRRLLTHTRELNLRAAVHTLLYLHFGVTSQGIRVSNDLMLLPLPLPLPPMLLQQCY